MVESFQIISTIRFDPELPTYTLPYGPSDAQPEDSPYYLLPFHFDRVLTAARDFGWTEAVARLNCDSDAKANIASFEKILDADIPDRTRAWRLRVLLHRSGNLTVEKVPTTSFSEHLLLIPTTIARETKPTFQSLLGSNPSAGSLPIWTLRADTHPTTPSLFTRHKTTARDMYTAARERVEILSPSDPVEVLVYNLNGEVMEGSITTVYFRRPSSRGDSEWVTPPLSSGGNNATTRRYALEAGLCEERTVRVEELIDGEEVWLSNGVRGFMRAMISLNGS